MGKILALIATVCVMASANATLLKQKDRQVTRIHGQTSLAGTSKSVAARGEGERNIARNSAGAIREGVQIRGNTTITANQDGAHAIASGRGNIASNEAGVIGGQ